MNDENPTSTSTCPACSDLLDIESLVEEGPVLVVCCVKGHRWDVKGFDTKVGQAPVYHLRGRVG